MGCCSILGCKSHTGRKCKGVTFHAFPFDAELKNKWIEATGRQNWLPKKHSVICSNHFKLNSLVVTSKRTYLIPSATPVNLIYGHSASENLVTATSESKRKPAIEKEKATAHSATQAERSGHLHDDCYCNVCNNDICGFRYVCVQCADYDLCAACEAAGLHGQHYVLRVPGGRAHEQITSILERLREELFNRESVAESIKMEIIEEPDPLVAAEVDVGADAWMDPDVPNESSRIETQEFASHCEILNAGPSTDDVIVAADAGQDIKVEVDASEQSRCKVFVHRGTELQPATTEVPRGRGVASRRAELLSPSAAPLPPWGSPHAPLAVVPGAYVLAVSGLRTRDHDDGER